MNAQEGQKRVVISEEEPVVSKVPLTPGTPVTPSSDDVQPEMAEEMMEEIDAAKADKEGISISYETASASTPKSGWASHNSYITVPAGTTIHNWVLFVAPMQMGDRERGSEKDNALLWFKGYAYSVNLYTWKIYARYKYRYWSSRDGVYLPDNRYPGGESGWVNYLLIRK